MSSDSKVKPKDVQLSWTSNINADGEYIRAVSTFRNRVKADGSGFFPAESGRYHLYISFGCPWAHRTLLYRKLKGLENVITVDVVDWHLAEGGWKFNPDRPGCTTDRVNNFEYLSQVYHLSDPDYNGRVTVPVLFDKVKNIVVNNESSEIISMLNSEFNEFCATPEQRELDLRPSHLASEIDELNSWIYAQINNGVYRAGFARKQPAYDRAVIEVFEGLDKVEGILAKNRYLTGKEITEADVRLFVTLIRFDLVYVLHFKCNLKRIIDYPNIWGYVRDIYQTPGISDTINFEHMKKHYMVSHDSINPRAIVAKGPAIDFNLPNDRKKLDQ
ncbi:Glutathionyl-hydroquinone reductase YqjG [Trichoplax sp. H2]|nr:Glutathionyl-hydroquinone reductase YqjG [Trichoplax sp. H2]|eukprot:RDD43627.1 Glutathionyl-hydroquinone reductase YqjG [Trichoplax sp. H2]